MSVLVSFPTPEPISSREVLRFAGGEASPELFSECIAEAKGKFSFKVCYTELSVSVEGDVCDFGLFSVSSGALAKNLRSCKRVLLFCATVGVGTDRLIAKYTRTAPSRALMLSALGSERIEALCDAFCLEFAKERGVRLRPRFSPGYADLPLDIQRDIFSILDPSRRIGVTLGERLLMTPTKSVTAFVGIEEN